MINVKEESTFAEALMIAQMQFKNKHGRYPNVEENNQLIEQLEEVRGGNYSEKARINLVYTGRKTTARKQIFSSDV